MRELESFIASLEEELKILTDKNDAEIIAEKDVVKLKNDKQDAVKVNLF